MPPAPDEIPDEQKRHRDGEEEQTALRHLKHPRLDERTAGGVKRA